MKKFIATFTYGNRGAFAMTFSRIRGIDASKKAVALKRANKYAAENFSNWDYWDVVIEELTPAKLKAIAAQKAEFDAQYAAFAKIRSALEDCEFVSKGYRTI